VRRNECQFGGAPLGREATEAFRVALSNIYLSRAANMELPLESLLENSPLAVIEWSSPDYRIVRWAGEATKVFGWTAEEAVGKRIDELNWIYPEDRPLIEQIMADMLSGRRPRNVNRNRNVRKDGSVIHCEWYNSTLRDDSGAFTVLSLVLDVTERKRAEAALVEAHRRTIAILESIADAFYSLDDQWRFVVVNPAAERAPFGRPAGELLGRVIWDVFPNLVGTPIYQHYLDAVRNRSHEHYEAQSPLNGRWYEVFMFPHEGGLDVYLRDIDDRKKAEETLRDRERLLSALFNSPGVMRGVVEIVADDDVRHIADNELTAAFVGLTPEAMRGKLGSELNEPRHVLRQWVAAYRQSEETNSTVSFEYLDKRGEHEAWVSAVVSYLGMEPGGKARFSYVADDVTERRRADEALRRSETQLRLLIENASAGVALVDKAGQFSVFNSRFLKMFGLAPDSDRKSVV
jgi:PAS domain S-box-containing protein